MQHGRCRTGIHIQRAHVYAADTATREEADKALLVPLGLDAGADRWRKLGASKALLRDIEAGPADKFTAGPPPPYGEALERPLQPLRRVKPPLLQARRLQLVLRARRLAHRRDGQRDLCLDVLDDVELAHASSSSTSCFRDLNGQGRKLTRRIAVLGGDAQDRPLTEEQTRSLIMEVPTLVPLVMGGKRSLGRFLAAFLAAPPFEAAKRHCTVARTPSFSLARRRWRSSSLMGLLLSRSTSRCTRSPHGDVKGICRA